MLEVVILGAMVFAGLVLVATLAATACLTGGVLLGTFRLMGFLFRGLGVILIGIPLLVVGLTALALGVGAFAICVALLPLVPFVLAAVVLVKALYWASHRPARRDARF